MRDVKIPEIGMKRSALTAPRDQIYYCTVCERVIPLSRAYGSNSLKAALSYLFTRYEKHYYHHHVIKPPFHTEDIRNDAQMPGKSGPKTKARALAMRKPPFKGKAK